MTEFGVFALGRSGDWELTVDEPVGGSLMWQVQVESPIVSLQFSITRLRIFPELNELLESSESKRANQTNSVNFGFYCDHSVIVHLCKEFSDRCFMTIGDAAEARLEVTLAGQNFIDFREALSQVVEELGLEQ